MVGKTEKKKNGTVAIVVTLFLVIAALVVAMVVILNKKGETPGRNDANVSDSAEPEKRAVVVNEENVDEAMEDLLEDAKVGAGNYEVTMSVTWNFPDGSSASPDAYVENSTANTNDVYFDVLLADTDEKIYSSPLLPIGTHVDGITLDKKLAAGTYDCVVVYSLVDEEQNVLSEVRVGLTVNVEQ
jgi:hypothetical protein